MKKIVIASPMLPCGVTWLINCFLELGIKTYRAPDSRNLWVQKNHRYFLNYAEVDLKRHLPVLSRKDEFLFINDIEVEWTHELPLERFRNDKIIYFVRDPRDAIHSWYVRLNPNISYTQFINMPDGFTLLDRVDYWILFNQLWCNAPLKEIRVFRFEDYKQDALSLLNRILEYCEIEFNPDAIELAVNESTYEKAKVAEERYRKLRDNQKKVLVNRASKPCGWKDQKGVNFEITNEISRRTLPWLSKFGYEIQEIHVAADTPLFPRLYLDAITYFDPVIKPSESMSRHEQECAYNLLLDRIAKKIADMKAQDIARYEKLQQFYGLILLRTIISLRRKTSRMEEISRGTSFILLKRTSLHYLLVLLRFNLDRLINLDIRYFTGLVNRMIYRFRYGAGHGR